MDNFYKYLLHSEKELEWGIYLNVAGKESIPANSVYPTKGHPSGYNFDWNKGRILDEYQLIYITKGQGVFELRDKAYIIKKGFFILLRPGVWHRYKPIKAIGWDGYYVGFKGNYIDSIFAKNEILRTTYIYEYYIDFEIIDAYDKIISIVKSEKKGFQQLVSGNIMQIIGKLVFSFQNRKIENSKIEHLVQNAQHIMQNQIFSSVNIEKLAEELNVGYSYFRREFKKYTGISPGQYHIQFKLQHARLMLINSDKNIKEIAHTLGFESPYHFSKLFKRHTGVNPKEYRLKPL